MTPINVPPKACIVCGAASHRTDWINVKGDVVACDSHSKEEFQNAIDKAAGLDAKPRVLPKPLTSTPVGSKPAVAGTVTSPLKSDNPSLAPAPVPAKPSDLSAQAPNKPVVPSGVSQAGNPVNTATPKVTI